MVPWSLQVFWQSAGLAGCQGREHRPPVRYDLQERAAKIADLETRRLFLENILPPGDCASVVIRSTGVSRFCSLEKEIHMSSKLTWYGHATWARDGRLSVAYRSIF
jgi:hypothetical protein